MIDRKRTGVNNYLYNLIKNMISNGKADEISLIHYERLDDPIYSQVKDIIIPEKAIKTYICTRNTSSS